LQLIVGLIGCKRMNRNRKGDQDVVGQPTALLNKKGEERKGRLPPLAIDHWIDWLQKRNRNRKGGPRCS